MEFINLTPENLAKEHICCAMTDKKGETGVASKKAWLRQRMAEGLVFRRLDARGKVFIEYLPAEKAWCPLTAPGYYYIDCLWVSGQYKGQGYAGELLQYAVDDVKAKGGKGLVILSSTKKKAFLADPGFLRHYGFLLADTAPPDFELLYLPFEADQPVPQFLPQTKTGTTGLPGLVIYYTVQCPFASKYAPLLQQVAQDQGEPLTLIELATREQAQQGPCPFTTFSLYDQGRFITNEILSEKKFQSYLQARSS